MSGLLCLLPGHKIGKDVDGVIRRESAGNANSKLTSTCIQDVVTRSNAFESRGSSHPAAVTGDVFTCKFMQLKFTPAAHTHTHTSVPNIKWFVSGPPFGAIAAGSL